MSDFFFHPTSTLTRILLFVRLFTMQSKKKKTSDKSVDGSNNKQRHSNLRHINVVKNPLSSNRRGEAMKLNKACTIFDGFSDTVAEQTLFDRDVDRSV